ncbi:MAG: outer membrane beta-barrel protein [Bacteroidia bacterium]
MKTKTLVIAAMALFFLPKEQKAQSWTNTTGIIVGTSTASVKFSNTGNAFTSTIKGNNIMGFEGGLFERFNYSMIFIKPMLLASYQGGTVTFYNTDGTVNTSKFAYGNIEVPLLFGLRILGPLRIEAGPVYNWIYATQYNDNNSIKINPSGLGYRIGANVEFGMVNLGIAYQGVTYKSSGSSSTTFNSPAELIFSVAICFGDRDTDK